MERPVVLLCVENSQLIQLIGHGPEKNALNTSRFIGSEFLAANFRRADEKPLAHLFQGAL